MYTFNSILVNEIKLSIGKWQIMYTLRQPNHRFMFRGLATGIVG